MLGFTVKLYCTLPLLCIFCFDHHYIYLHSLQIFLYMIMNKEHEKGLWGNKGENNICFHYESYQDTSSKRVSAHLHFISLCLHGGLFFVCFPDCRLTVFFIYQTRVELLFSCFSLKIKTKVSICLKKKELRKEINILNKSYKEIGFPFLLLKKEISNPNLCKCRNKMTASSIDCIARSNAFLNLGI